MSQDLIRIIDGICREKNIDRDSFLADLENAIASAMRKEYSETADAEVHLDPLSGSIRATLDGEPLEMATLGRIAAQTAKQVIIQKTRERERTSIFADFTERRGQIMTGTVVRVEGGNLLVNLARTEGFLPRSERIPGETHQVGERIRVMVLDVREQGTQVKVVLSRSHPDFIIRLFELEVPEVAERIIEIRAVAREAGYRSKVAVTSIDTKVDAAGACIGVRGSRIKNIVDELNGEKVDIVRWNESSQILIQNSLKPAEVQEIALCFELGKATVVVTEDQLSLAIGKRGQNVRLAARLTKWDIDILTPAEYNKNLETMERVCKSVEGVDDVVLDKMIAIGCTSVADIDDVGPEVFVEELEMDAELAERIVEAAGEEVIRQEEQKEAQAKAKAEAEAAGLPAPDAAPSGFIPSAEEGGGEAETAAETPTATTESQDAGADEPGKSPVGLVAGALDADAIAPAAGDDLPETPAGPEETPSAESANVEDAPSAESTPAESEAPPLAGEEEKA